MFPLRLSFRFALLISLAASLAGTPLRGGQDVPWPYAGPELPVYDDLYLERFENGLTFAFVPSAQPPGQISLRLLVNVGSLDEDEEEEGLAHLLEHMAFLGSENIEPGTFFDTFQEIGVKTGSHSNASTNFQETIYVLDLPGNSENMLRKAFTAFSDIAFKLNIPEEHLTSEKAVVERERQLRDSKGFRAYKALTRSRYQNSRLAERFPIGEQEDVEALTREDLLAFYESYYRPEKTWLIAVGDSDLETVRRLAREYFLPWKGEGELVPPGSPGLTFFSAGPEAIAPFIIDEGEEPLLLLSIDKEYTPHPETRQDRFTSYKWQLIDSLARQRWQRLLESGEAPFTLMEGQRSKAYRAVETLDFTTGLKGEDWESAVRYLGAFLSDFPENLSESELVLAKRKLRSSLESWAENEDSRKTPQILYSLMQSLDYGTPFLDPSDYLEIYELFENQLDLDSLKEEFSQRTEEGLWTLALLWPNEEVESPAPNTEEVRRIFLEGYGLGAQLAAVKTGWPGEEGTDFAYKDFGLTGEIVERKETVIKANDKLLPFRFTRFENGLELFMLKSDNNPNQLSMTMASGDGLLSAPNTALASSAVLLSGPWVQESGLEKHPASELESLFADQSLSYDFIIGTDTVAFFGSSETEDSLELLQVLAAHRLNSAFSPAVFSNNQGFLSSLLEDNMSFDYQLGLAGQLLGYNEDPRFQVLLGEGEKLSDDSQALRVFLERQLSSGPASLQVVGDFEFDELEEQVAVTLGALPPYTDPTDSPLPVRATEKRRLELWHDEGESRAQLAVYIPFVPGETGKDRLAEDALEIWIDDQLRELFREKRAKSYAPSAYLDIDETLDNVDNLVLSVDLPQGEAEAELAVLEEAYADLTSRQPDEEEMKSLKAQVRASLEEAMAYDQFWEQELFIESRKPGRLEQTGALLEALEDLTPEDVAASFSKLNWEARGIAIINSQPE